MKATSVLVLILIGMCLMLACNIVGVPAFPKVSKPLFTITQ